MGSAISKSGKRAARKTLAAAIAAKGLKETKQVIAELDAEEGNVPMKPSKEWTEQAMRIAYQRGVIEGRERGIEQGKFEAQQLPSENLVQVIEMFRELHDGRKIECISSTDICLFIDQHGEPVDEAAAICAVMPIARRVLDGMK